jgi:hypothetical protein
MGIGIRVTEPAFIKHVVAGLLIGNSRGFIVRRRCRVGTVHDVGAGFWVCFGRSRIWI